MVHRVTHRWHGHPSEEAGGGFASEAIPPVRFPALSRTTYLPGARVNVFYAYPLYGYGWDFEIYAVESVSRYVFQRSCGLHPAFGSERNLGLGPDTFP